MQTTAYERAMFGASANDDARPKRPNVIDEAIKVFGGRGHYRHSWKGHEFWRGGKWNGPYTLQGFIQQANIVLLGGGKPQISANPAWVITEAEVCI
jgi:hypothetical protein